MTILRIALAAVGLLTLGAAPGPSRNPTVELTIRFSRFSPSVVRVAPGTVVRFVVRNTDPIDHELIVGPDDVQRRHELGTEAHHGARPGEVTVPLGGSAMTTYTFTSRGPGPQTVPFACHLPGHYAYGMRGSIVVS